MACDCNKLNFDCDGPSISSNCVTWQGKPIPVLGICTGDPLTFVELKIIEKITEILDKEDKSLEDFNVNTCPALRDILGAKDPDLGNLIQTLWTDGCTLRDLIKKVDDKVNNQINKPLYPFDKKCTTPVQIGSTLDTEAYVQGVINQVCALQAKVDSIAPSVETIIKDTVGNILANMITSLGNWGIQKTGSGADIKFNFLALAPPFSAMAYIGPISNFDGQGKGVIGTPYEGWLFINGLNGLPDARGRALIASINGVPGGPMDTAVDPSRPENPGVNYSPGDKFGSSYVSLAVSNIPSHSHAVNDPGHTHSNANITMMLRRVRCSTSNCESWWPGGDPISVGSSQTGITLGNTGDGQPIENRQPSLVVTGWIVRLP